MEDIKSQAKEAYQFVMRSGLTPKQISQWLVNRPGVQWEMVANVYHFPDGSKIKASRKFGSEAFTLVNS